MDLTVYEQQGRYVVAAGDKVVSAVIGRSGLIDADRKREGDGATPRGSWLMQEVLFRPDRISLPETRLMAIPISADDGWCDDPASPSYNRKVRLPFDASHEKLWRDDHAYDVIIPLGYNDAPVAAGRGSAIFFHCREDGRDHTEGCVAISRTAMQNLLPHLTPQSRMIIDP